MDAGIHNLYALYTLDEIHVPGVSPIFFICESRDQKNKHEENNK